MVKQSISPNIFLRKEIIVYGFFKYVIFLLDSEVGQDLHNYLYIWIVQTQKLGLNLA